MVGEFAVGKTSLTQKFVNNVFSDKYLTTVGVKIDTVIMGETKLIIWDVAGEDSLSPLNANYLVGATGVVLVADGTREPTIAALSRLKKTIEERIGGVPIVVALNKHDDPNWSVTDQQLAVLDANGLEVMNTSAKQGNNVGLLFEALLAKMT